MSQVKSASEFHQDDRKTLMEAGFDKIPEVKFDKNKFIIDISADPYEWSGNRDAIEGKSLFRKPYTSDFNSSFLVLFPKEEAGQDIYDYFDELGQKFPTLPTIAWTEYIRVIRVITWTEYIRGIRVTFWSFWGA